MEPPAPVTITTCPVRSVCRPASVERHGIALHQVSTATLRMRAGDPLPAKHVVQRGHRHHRDARALADLHHAPARLVGHRGHGDDRVAQLEALREALQVLERAQHAHAVNEAPALLLVVVEEPTTRHSWLRESSFTRPTAASPAPRMITGAPCSPPRP